MFSENVLRSINFSLNFFSFYFNRSDENCLKPKRRLLVQTKWQRKHFMLVSLSGILLKGHQEIFPKLF